MSSPGGWNNFVQVTQHVLKKRRLFRASAPHYDGADSTQRLTQESVDFLTSHQINRIISFNEYKYTEAELKLLDGSPGIAYLHLPIIDFGAPTLEQLLRAIEFYKKEPLASTIVHCGFGWGRTGTGITALQLFQSFGAAPPESDWESVNHVEKPGQMKILRDMRDRYKGQAHLDNHDEL